MMPNNETQEQLQEQYRQAVEEVMALGAESEAVADELVAVARDIRKCSKCGMIVPSWMGHCGLRRGQTQETRQGRPFLVESCHRCGKEMGRTALRLHLQVHLLESTIQRKQDRRRMLLDQIEKLEEKRLSLNHNG